MVTNKSFVDADTYVVNTSDNTKKVKFDCSGVTTANTRTLTVPDTNGTLVVQETTENTVTSSGAIAKQFKIRIINTHGLKNVFVWMNDTSANHINLGSGAIPDGYRPTLTGTDLYFTGSALVAGTNRVVMCRVVPATGAVLINKAAPSGTNVVSEAFASGESFGFCFLSFSYI